MFVFISLFIRLQPHESHKDGFERYQLYQRSFRKDIRNYEIYIQNSELAKTMIPANPCLGIKFKNNLFTAPTIHTPEEALYSQGLETI